MKEIIYFQKILSSFSFTMFLYPIFLTIAWLTSQEHAVLFLPFMLFAFVWSTFSCIITKKRLLLSILGLIPLIAGSIFILLPIRWIYMLILIPCTLNLIFVPHAYPLRAYDEWPFAMWIIGIFCYLAVRFAAFVWSFQSINDMLSIGFCVYILLMLITFNENSVMTGMHGSAKAPAALRQKNLIMAICVYLIVLLVSFADKITELLRKAAQLIADGIIWLIYFLLTLFGRSDEGSGGGSDGGSMMNELIGEAPEQSLLSKILEKIAISIAIVLTLVLLYFLIRFLIKKLKKLWQIIAEKLKAFSDASSRDYVDVVESIAPGERKEGLGSKLKSMLKTHEKTPAWNELDARQKIRFTYREYMKKTKPDASKTVSEVLNEDKTVRPGSFALIYQEARYSNHAVSPETAEAMKDALKTVRKSL